MSLTPPHARGSRHTSSARSRTYGNQPICPSEYASFRAGKRTSTPEKRKSERLAIELLKLNVAATATGASLDVLGICDDEPMCMHTTVFVSSHAAKNGSHAPEWIDGRPSLGGISLEQTACKPRAALRRTSSAASCAPQSGMMISGINLPSLSPHHSSTIQSLYASTHACARSRSFASRNVWPQKRGNVGNDSDASTQFIVMSSRRAFGS